MEKNINKTFVAPVRKIKSITLNPHDLSEIVTFDKFIYWDIFYFKKIPKEVAISLTNKMKFNTTKSNWTKENDLIVDERYAIPLIEFCINQNIEMFKKRKINSKQAQKIFTYIPNKKAQSDNK